MFWLNNVKTFSVAMCTSNLTLSAFLMQVMAFGMFLMDTKEGPNIYKMDAKRRINISKIDRILKVGCTF